MLIIGATLEPVAPLEVSANRWVAASTSRKPIAPDADSPELVDRKVRSLLNKLSMEKFDSISDQIITWANKSENEKDGRTLIQVIRLVFDKATDSDEAAWSEMYAGLCWMMMVTISPEVQDDGIRNTDGKPIAGGQLVRKHLLTRCQEDFERGWFAKETTATAVAAANNKKGEENLYSDQYCAAQKAKRQGLGLIKFIGELFKFQMLTERVMHGCVKKLLGNVENPEEEEIESLCQLLRTVGQQLDVPKARAHMDVYFARMKELRKDLNVSPRMQFMLQDVIELRERRWVGRGCVSAPTTIAADHEAAAKEEATAKAQIYQHRPLTARSSKLLARTPSIMLTFSNVTSASTTPATTSTTVKPALGKADIAKLFQGSSTSSQPSSDTSSPSTRPSNLPPHHQSSSSGQQPPQPPPQPSQPGAHQSTPFVPGMRQQQGASGSRSPAFSRPVPNGTGAPPRPMGGPGGPVGPPIPTSPRLASHHSHPHQPPAVPPHTPQPPPQHSHQPSGSIGVSSPPPTPSTASGPGIRSINTNASTFVPTTRPPPKEIVIKNEDGAEVNLESLRKHNPQPLNVPIPLPSPVATSRRTASVRIESEESKRKREEQAQLELEKKKGGGRAKTEEQDRKRKSLIATSCWTTSVRIEREEAKQKWDNSGGSGHCQASGTMTPSTVPQSSVGPGVTGGFWGKAGISPSPFATLEPVAPLEVSANRWVTASTARRPIAADADSCELVDRKVRSLLNKLTMEKFDSISDQIVAWANESENENDGRTLIQVVGLVFEKATNDAARSEMYARLCRKMMETISPEVQEDGIKNTKGKPIVGGQLFRKYLLDRCHEDFKRGWFHKETTEAAVAAKAPDDQAIKAANEKRGKESLYSDQYCAAQKAKRRGLGVIKFIGELFKLQMLTERSMHECVKKLLVNVENPGEEEIESLCQLLKTVGQQLDVPKAWADMDVYFARMKELRKDLNVSPRMQFMLQDVIELRERRWAGRGGVSAPTTIAADHKAAAKEKATAEAQIYQRQLAKLSAALVPKMDLHTFCDHFNLSLAILQKLDVMKITGPHGLRFVSNTDLREIGKLHIGELADVRDAQERWTLGL